MTQGKKVRFGHFCFFMMYKGSLQSGDFSTTLPKLGNKYEKSSVLQGSETPVFSSCLAHGFNTVPWRQELSKDVR